MFDAQVALVVGSAFGSRRVRSLAGRRIPHVGRIQNGDVFEDSNVAKILDDRRRFSARTWLENRDEWR